MSSQKVLAVCGATGNQGGSVIDSILGDQQTKAQWKLRGLTRSAQSEKAKALAEKSVEVVEVGLILSCSGRHYQFFPSCL